VSLLHVDPAMAEDYLKAAQSRLDAEAAQTKDLEARKRADPTYQAIREELATQESAKAAAREREAHEQAAAAAGVAERGDSGLPGQTGRRADVRRHRRVSKGETR
jgi:hypothetical protein